MMKELIRKVFSFRYIILFLFTAFLVFVFSAWLPNLSLVWQIIWTPSASFLEKITILSTLMLSIGTNFTSFTLFVTIAISFLFGINVSLLVFYMRQRRSFINQGKAVAGAGFGLFSGFLSIGCAACGTLVLAPLITFLGASVLLSVLPFAGQEFGILGIFLLLFSIYSLSKKILIPSVCRVE